MKFILIYFNNTTQGIREQGNKPTRNGEQSARKRRSYSELLLKFSCSYSNGVRITATYLLFNSRIECRSTRGMGIAYGRGNREKNS